MEEMRLPRMKLALILVTVAVFAAFADDKEDLKCPEKCARKCEPACPVDFCAERFLPKSLPNKCCVTIYNCQRETETQYKVIYKGESNDNETTTEK